MENSMTTKEIIQKFYDLIERKEDWQDLIADEMEFVSDGKTTHTKKEYVEPKMRFIQLVKSLKIHELIVEGNKACISVEYDLKLPSGKALNCEITEILMLKDNRINSSCIFFNTESFSSLIAQG